MPAGYSIHSTPAEVERAAPATTRTIAYIDGFNLYHGLHERFGRRYLWLDLVKLVRKLRPRDNIVAVRYFTAMILDDEQALLRQQTYVDALHAQSGSLLDVVMGRYQAKRKRCFTCGSSWTSYEEKETDVNMAVSLVADAASGDHDLSLILSADSDLCPAIRAVRAIAPQLGILSVFPPGRSSFEIRSLVPGNFMLGHDKIRQSLLPDSVIDVARTVTFRRPQQWK
ncbi:MAG: NYN domain-containing protein [Acidimicrobiales bacterium]|nr:MAG: NYN domain-containing protein [Acidimicrobiales bacterium]